MNAQLTPAAQYLRMSTEDQQYSLDNQSDAIRKYAAEHDLQVISTYSDPGRSGVDIKHRIGLKTLLQDVLSGDAPYRTILVYDVSRWGRFQDVDEAAHYEYLCKQAGIPVRYCAEPFESDSTMSGAIMKALKRTMAAEYSRELGIKVYAGQKRLVLLGFLMSGKPPFGLRRMIISSDGRRRRILKRGQRKAIKSDRSILIPGPKREVECVRHIFDLAARGMTPEQITAELNKHQIKGAEGRSWHSLAVFRVLRNETYIGTNVWGRTTKALGKRARRLPRELWIRKSDSFTPIVSPDVFNRVQKHIARRTTFPARPDEVLLNRMRRVLAKHGRLSQRLLKPVAFDYRTYCKRFGSVLRAYELVGYKAPAHAIKSGERQRKIRKLRFRLLDALKDLFPERLRVIQEPVHNQRRFIEIDGTLNIAVQVGCPARSLVDGKPRWLLKVHPLERGLTTLVCTTDRELNNILDYYVVPQFGRGMRRYRVLGRDSAWLRFSEKLTDLADFCDVVTEIAGTRSEDCIKNYQVGDAVFSEHTRTISIANKEICLGHIEFAIFKLLLLNAGKVVPRKALCEAIPNRVIPYLTVHMCVLRRKLSRFRGRLQTIKTVGYVYIPESRPNTQIFKLGAHASPQPETLPASATESKRLNAQKNVP